MTHNFKIYGYNTVAEAGFPDVLCPVVFVNNCNFKCPYCLNKKLVLNENLKELNINTIIEEMKKNNENQVLISGGEPCINPHLIEIIEFFKNNKFQVRLSTNGSCPDVLRTLIKNDIISFAAIDIKTGFQDENKWRILYDNKIMDKILETIELINNTVNFSFEFRTTLYPPLVNKEDIKSISQNIRKDSIWILQQFRNNNNLLGGKINDNIKPYNEETINDFVQIAKKNIDRTFVRYT